MLRKKIVLVEILYCFKNENSCEEFIKKFNWFTDNKFDVQWKRLTQKKKNTKPVLSKSLHLAYKICNGACSFFEGYII